MVLKDAREANWTCSHCHTVLSEQSVNAKLSFIGKQPLNEGNDDIQRYETLLKKSQKLFHPNHFMILEIKQNLASILRFMLKNSMYEPSKEVLKRKLQLCEDLLPVVRAVIPGYSKLYALALYEYLLSFIELTELDRCTEAITKEIYSVSL